MIVKGLKTMLHKSTSFSILPFDVPVRLTIVKMNLSMFLNEKKKSNYQCNVIIVFHRCNVRDVTILPSLRIDRDIR